MLAGDANLRVRRAAAANPNLPRGLLDALRSLGASDDLSAGAAADAGLSAQTLRELSAGGEWTRERVARHPNTPGDLLNTLSRDPADAVRIAVAQHPATRSPALQRLLTDADPRVRAAAVEHPDAPGDWLGLLVRAGSTADLQGVSESPETLDAESLRSLIEGGPWARRVAASHPQASTGDLIRLAQDDLWWVRAAVAHHPSAPREALDHLKNLDVPEVQAALASHPNAPPATLDRLSREDHSAIRAAVAANPNTPAGVLTRMLGDGAGPIRAAAAGNPATPREAIHTMRRAGSSDGLNTFAPPDESLDKSELDRLSRGGDWARQLAARHPNTPPDALSRLAADGHFLVRETVARRHDLPASTRDLFARAGSSDDLQGFAKPHAAISGEELERVAAYGPWGRRLAARHPDADAGLLARLAEDADWQVRRAVARHGTTGPDTLVGLAQDVAADVRWSLLKHPAPPPEVFVLLASDGRAPIRLAIATDQRTPRKVVECLRMDLDEDVRTAAREQLGA